jgi:hypothetical protein
LSREPTGFLALRAVPRCRPSVLDCDRPRDQPHRGL